VRGVGECPDRQYQTGNQALDLLQNRDVYKRTKGGFVCSHRTAEQHPCSRPWRSISVIHQTATSSLLSCASLITLCVPRNTHIQHRVLASRHPPSLIPELVSLLSSAIAAYPSGLWLAVRVNRLAKLRTLLPDLTGCPDPLVTTTKPLGVIAGALDLGTRAADKVAASPPLLARLLACAGASEIIATTATSALTSPVCAA
jgi:hypothetical protein